MPLEQQGGLALSSSTASLIFSNPCFKVNAGDKVRVMHVEINNAASSGSNIPFSCIEQRTTYIYIYKTPELEKETHYEKSC